MPQAALPLDQVIQGNCIEILGGLPEKSIDLIFADPPYNLQLRNDLYRPNLTRVDPVNDAWDQFSSFDEYDTFVHKWLSACRRVLKDDGAIWVIGTYHNIYRLGTALQDLGFWILNDIVWIKTNPMPNFRGVRFTNAHETLLWASKSKGARYTFNHHAMKRINDDLQMRSDWLLPICNGHERLRENGKKVHPTQKPESLLYRVISAASQPGDVVLDPFFGTGTSGAVAKKLHRHYIGIEREEKYVEIARQRLDAIDPAPFDPQVFEVRGEKRRLPRISFASLIELGMVAPGQKLYFQKNMEPAALVKPDGRLLLPGFEGSIHQAGRHLTGDSPCNGWDHWYYQDEQGELQPIDLLRQAIRKELPG